MKKKILLIILTLSLIIIPTTNTYAVTLKEYQDKLKKYQDEQEKNNSDLQQTTGAITSSNKEIENIKLELKKMTEEIEQMRLDSIEYKNQISDKEIETKEILEYYQLSQGTNLYLEYAFNAETITDLVYRLSIVEQLIEHNETTVNNLNDMIEANNKREVELKEKEEEMNKRQQELTDKISRLNTVKASLNENSVSVAQQIKIYKELVESYVKLGCQPHHVIGVDCARENNAGEWKRPIVSGYVTSEFGYRWGSLHRAIDVSNKNPYSTKIYPVANGRIVAKYSDYYGALTVVIEHKTASGKYYSSLYTHMSKYNPNIYVGMNITTDTYIGYMGATGYAYGPHLHLEIAPCRLYNQYDSNCSSWNKYTSYMSRIYNNGSFKGPRSLINFPNPYVLFNGR